MIVEIKSKFHTEWVSDRIFISEEDGDNAKIEYENGLKVIVDKNELLKAVRIICEYQKGTLK